MSLARGKRIQSVERACGKKSRAKWAMVRFAALYDLSVDQHEVADVSNKYPEVLEQLMKEFDNWNDQMLPRPPARH